MTIHRLCIKLDTSNPTCIGTLLPLQPCAFSHRRLQQGTTHHHQLEHRHCFFITSVSAEPRLPHLNNSSYRVIATSSHRSLLNQARSPSDGPLNSGTSVSFTRLPPLEQTPTITSTFSPSNPWPSSPRAPQSPHYHHHSHHSPLFHLDLSSIFHDFTSTPSGHLDVFSHKHQFHDQLCKSQHTISYLHLAASTQEQHHHQNGQTPAGTLHPSQLQHINGLSSFLPSSASAQHTPDYSV
jgi:hypothetical protein